MTREEFIKGWAERSGEGVTATEDGVEISVSHAVLIAGVPATRIDTTCMYAVPCDCGDEGCEGWKMITPPEERNVYIHR